MGVRQGGAPPYVTPAFLSFRTHTGRRTCTHTCAHALHHAPSYLRHAVKGVTPPAPPLPSRTLSPHALWCALRHSATRELSVRFPQKRQVAYVPPAPKSRGSGQTGVPSRDSWAPPHVSLASGSPSLSVELVEVWRPAGTGPGTPGGDAAGARCYPGLLAPPPGSGPGARRGGPGMCTTTARCFQNIWPPEPLRRCRGESALPLSLRSG